MKVYIYYDKNKPEENLIYNVLLDDIELLKIEIEAEDQIKAMEIFEQMVRDGEV